MTESVLHTQIQQGITEILVDVQKSFEVYDFDPILDLLETELQEHHTDHFALERAPDGTDWPQLAPSTIARKGHNRILFEFGDLMASLTEHGPDAIRRKTTTATSGEIIFGTSDFKSSKHQSGTSKLPKREHVGMSEIFVDSTVETVTDSVVETLRGEQNAVR